MKKNSIKILITSVLIILISFLSSFIITNYNILKLNKSERKIENIENDNFKFNGLEKENNILKSILDSEEKEISINYSGYINKLVINYNAEENFYVTINYTGKDYYKKESEKNIKEGFNSRLDKSVVKIDDYVDNLSLTINYDNSFEISSIQIDNGFSFNIYLFLIIFVSLTIIFIIYLYMKHNLFHGKVEYLFLIIAILTGSLYIFLKPNTTSNSWDDQIHYFNMFRIFEIDGDVEWSRSDDDMTMASPFIGIDTLEEKKIVNDYLNSAQQIVKVEKTSPFISYNQIGYLLPGLILKISALIGLPFTLKIVFAKFSMLLFYSLTIFFAIKIAPYGKRIISVVGLLPSCLFLATEFSYDSPIIAGLILFTALFIKIMYDEDCKINLRYVTLLLLSILIPSFIKAIYIPLILLLLFIPSSKFECKSQHKYFKIGIILIFILMILSFALPAVGSSAVAGDVRGGNTSVAGQLSNVLDHPIGYEKVLEDTMVDRFFSKMISKSTLINYAYNKQTDDIGDNYYYIVLILLLFVIITDSYDNIVLKNKKFIKIVNVILISGVILLIWTALYLSFTPVGYTTINGVQNRYFIPLLIPLILITFGNNKIKSTFNIKKYDAVLFILIGFVLLSSLYNDMFLTFVN